LRIYVVDNDYLIWLTTTFSPDRWTGFWAKIGELKAAGRLVTHRHVRLEYSHDETSEIVFAGMRVYDFDKELMSRYAEVVKRFERRWKWEFKGGIVADQAIITLAAHINAAATGAESSGPAMVLTRETANPVGCSWYKIPNVCADMGIDCPVNAKLDELEQWSF
jgi:hypothetical protein